MGIGGIYQNRVYDYKVNNHNAVELQIQDLL